MKSTYRLQISLKKPVTVEVGRLGLFTFPPGVYFYTGSARRNMEARIKRHLSKKKKLRWHIDYLLVRPEAVVEEVETFRAGECALNRRTRGRRIIPGFGASDCRNGCKSHLKYAGAKISHQR